MYWLINCLSDLIWSDLIDWLIDWLREWLIERLIGWQGCGCHVLLIFGIPEMCSRIARFRNVLIADIPETCNKIARFRDVMCCSFLASLKGASGLRVSGMQRFVYCWHPWNVQQDCAFQGCHVLFIASIPEMRSRIARFRDAMCRSFLASLKCAAGFRVSGM